MNTVDTAIRVRVPKSISQAVILAGGRGERLKPLTDTIPKPLAPVNGVPFLDYLIYSLIIADIDRILILLGYRGGLIAERYASMSKINVEFSYGAEDEKTGRRLLNAYDRLDNHFLLMYGDNYWPIELAKMWNNYQDLRVPVTTTIFSNKNGTGEYGWENNVVVGSDSIVHKYDKIRETSIANGLDIGYFLVAKDALDPGVQGNISFEDDILNSLISTKELGAFLTDTQYHWITDVSALERFQAEQITKRFAPLPCEYFESPI
jgi:NDP-sugar pyrophosphorylase family protein